jgi:Lon protease-like protein
MQMLAKLYRSSSDLPQRIPVFPLRGVILLPRARLPLTVFEPRYLAMVDDVVSGDRIIAIVQPDAATGREESPPGKFVALRSVACAGRLTAYQELDDGRLLITLTGIARCLLVDETETAKPYRIFTVNYDAFADDFTVGAGEGEVDRQCLLDALKSYFDACDLRVDWTAVASASSEALVNSFAVASPHTPEEKQALLEAPDLKSRAQVLIALAKMGAASPSGGSDSTLQ